jgi:hypothetical protein
MLILALGDDLLELVDPAVGVLDLGTLLPRG